MSDFKAKMHQIEFRLGLCPRPRCGSLSAPPDLLAAIGGPTSKGRGGERSPHFLLTTLTTAHYQTLM